ncbi:Apoptotic protease-activating factor 1 [Papilio machaon]|uniref:Apoptotic protease-activating factor 1 n=1 Tax=Papilio machaon TaxID=76193 RepID=A0A194RAV4_PAPMA|nr:Apoptotic protease-activating factor 1 [Papilio machaon]
MDTKYRVLLQHHQQDVVRDLDVTYILDELFTKDAISNEDFDNIYKLSSRVDRTRYLIDSLLQNGTNRSYEAFVDSLAKDWQWLYKKFTEESNEAMLNDSFEDGLSRGDVPRLPDHYVRRNAVEQEVANKLKLLTRHKILALHGMPGCGKTTVAISVLRNNPDLITNNFNGAVFWLNFGNCKTEDDITALQNKLYRKATTISSHNSYMTSSISMSSTGSNADSHSFYDWSWEDMKDRLISQFQSQSLKECLLVLDEVNEKKCLRAFDIGCKILITTPDTDVVLNFQAQIVKVENNFTEQETLELFSLCLDQPVPQLPREARKLYEICAGSPFHIALIGAQLSENRERFKHDHKYRNSYLNKLEKRAFFFLTRHHENPQRTVEVCINLLQPDILNLFKKLTVLPDNVKVSAKVLTKLWNRELTEVESIIKQLRSKSLIIEFYDREQQNYIYEVHVFIMDYLRTCWDEEDVKKLHENFLKSYNYSDTSNPPLDIEDDGYIAFYIGHHILKTKNLGNKWSLFNKLFLDLKFLGNKVRLTGSADVILDLQKYETYIAEDTLDKELLYSIKAYLITHGTDLYRYPYTDIVQSILQHESKGILYTKASAIAKERCAKNELYFEFLHEQNVEEIKHTTIDVTEIITAVCFLGDHVLIGTDSGLIKFFNISTNIMEKELPGKGFSMKWLGACPMNPPVVAALDSSGFITIFYIDDIGHDETDDVIEEETEESYNNNYANIVNIPPKLGPFLNCRWANNEETLITHTSKMIILYDPSGKVLKVLDNFDRDREILCCVPCNNDKQVIVATSGVHSLEVIDLISKEKVMSFEESEPLVNILTISGSNRIITLSETNITEHEYKINTGLYQNVCNVYICRRVLTSEEVKGDVNFVAAEVNKSGTLLFVATDDSRVICVDLKTNTRVFDLDNRRGNVTTMAVSEVMMWDDFMPGSDVLLTGTGSVENTAKVWFLDASFVSQNTHRNSKVRLTTTFDVSFLGAVTPQTPSTTPNSGTQSQDTTPRRHKSFVTHKEIEKRLAKKTMSLDRHNLKPLNLKGICNGNNDGGIQPLLAVVDDKNNIQIMRGRKLLTEISPKTDDQITAVKISPCNQYIIYGLSTGIVTKYALRSKECKDILDVYSPVLYMSFVNPDLLIVAGKNRCLMAYRFTTDGDWKSEMLQRGNCFLGSQEILNDIQGFKKKISPEKLSASSSDASISSRDRLFPNGDTRGRLCKASNLVSCFWISDVGLITVETNAIVKLWDRNLQVANILNGRQTDVYINCAAFQKNILAICDDYHRFQTYELKTGDKIELQPIQVYKLNNRIVCCDLTADGSLLAMGLDSGNVIVWHVSNQRQLRFLKHHKTKVQWCRFSPVPERLSRGSSHSPSLAPQSPAPPTDDEAPPLVLVTMAAEIVWWNITYIIKTRINKNFWRNRWNAVTPIASPVDTVNLIAAIDNLHIDAAHNNFFFGSGLMNAQECWKCLWKGKTCKEGSKKKEILACIKLSGVNAKKLCCDEKFSCFVTVDHPGHIHIMNLMHSNT